jgi:hypothetical protein
VAAAAKPAVPAAAAKPAVQAAAAATGGDVATPKVPSGYRAKKSRSGETVYCKNVARIGSNLQTETCMTAAEVEELERNAEFNREQFRRNQAVCGTGNCGGS